MASSARYNFAINSSPKVERELRASLSLLVCRYCFGRLCDRNAFELRGRQGDMWLPHGVLDMYSLWWGHRQGYPLRHPPDFLNYWRLRFWLLCGRLAVLLLLFLWDISRNSAVWKAGWRLASNKVYWNRYFIVHVKMWYNLNQINISTKSRVSTFLNENQNTTCM